MTNAVIRDTENAPPIIMPPCDHRDRFLDHFCFDCWREQNAAKRAARRVELARLLASGATICERRGTASATDWRLTPDGTVMAGSVPERGAIDMHVAFCVPFTADRLAEHLESREYGFGWTLTPYCVDCGEQPATTTNGAPVCDTCETARIARAAQIDTRDLTT